MVPTIDCTHPTGNCPSKFEQDGRENSAHNLRLQPAGESVFVENKKGNGMPGRTVNGLSIHRYLSIPESVCAPVYSYKQTGTD